MDKFNPENIKINTTSMDFVKPNIIDAVKNTQSKIQQQISAIAEKESLKKAKEQAQIQREIQLNEMIQKIVENTAYLPEMVGLIRKNNEVNEEMLGLFQEMTNVLKAQTEEEAKGIIMDVVDKAKNTNDALDAMSGLLNYGKLLLKLAFPESDIGV